MKAEAAAEVAVVVAMLEGMEETFGGGAEEVEGIE